MIRGTINILGVIVGERAGSADRFSAWRAVEHQTVPLVELYDIDINDTDPPVRIVNGDPGGTGGLTYQGNAYTPFAVQREEVREDIDLSLFSHKLHVSNVNGIAGSYIEQNNLEGRTVTITYIPLSLIEDPETGDALIETWKIQDQAYSRDTATLTLGNPNLLDRTIPFRQYLRHRCQWNYAKRFETGPEGCFYPSDYFEDDTEQDFLDIAVADSEKQAQHGWFMLNATKASVADANITDLGKLRLTYPDASVVAAWDDTATNGPFIFKKLSGDFDVFTSIEGTWSTNSQFGIICQGSLAPYLDDWVALFRTGASPYFTARVTVNGVSTDTTSAVEQSYFRLVRTGNSFDFYRSADGVTWTKFHTGSATLGDPVRIGLGFSQDAAGTGAVWARWPYFRFTGGGLSACTRLLDGANGCNEHANTTHFFAFRGIPRS